MKFKYVLLMISIGLFSCSSDDDNQSESVVPDVISIVGNWELTSVMADIPVDLDGDGTISSNLLEELPCFMSTYLINEDNTFEQTSVDVDVNINILVLPPMIEADCLETSSVEVGTWSLEEDQLTITDEDGEVRIFMVTLTETTLSFSDDIEDIGQADLVFTRQ